MKNLKVALSGGGYEILIGPGLLSQTGGKLKELGFEGKTVVVTNPKVKDLYGNCLKTSLDGAGFTTAILEVPDGEEYKSLDWAGKLYQQLNDFQAERMTPILALGGGVIGDLAGFVAATYMRGVPLIQLPTTLLAQVDSGIGGKTAVNYGQLKNMIGVFYQPKLVISDISTLKTLPVRESKNGLAEIIKYAVILDLQLFQLLEVGLDKLKSSNEEWMEEVIFRCAGIKSRIIEKDEKDQGLRNILNYGHTVGHAIEAVSDFKIKHGKAVAIGMVAAATISQKMDILPFSALDKIKSVIIRAGLQTGIPGLDLGKIMQAMEHDKKKVGGKIKFVLPKSIGDAFITDEVSPALVEQVLRELYAEAQDLRYSRPE